MTKVENQKHKWTKEEIKRFLDTADTIRDKAIIACMFQSGLAVKKIDGAVTTPPVKRANPFSWENPRVTSLRATQ